MSPAKTAAERKADERQRHKEAGRTAVTVYVRPEYVPEVRALEAKLQRRENRKRGCLLGRCLGTSTTRSCRCSLTCRSTWAGGTATTPRRSTGAALRLSGPNVGVEPHSAARKGLGVTNETAQPTNVGSNDQLGLVPERGELCQPEGLKFDAFGEPRARYMRVTLNRGHCVMHPSEGDCYVQDARDAGDPDWERYIVRDVWLSEREFEDLPEHDGF